MDLLSFLSNLGTFATLESWINQKLNDYKESRQIDKLNQITEEFSEKELIKIKDNYAKEKLDDFISKHSLEYTEIRLNLFSDEQRKKVISYFINKNNELKYIENDIAKIINLYLNTLEEYLNNIVSIDTKVICNKIDELKKDINISNDDIKESMKLLDSNNFKRALKYIRTEEYEKAIDLLEELQYKGTIEDDKRICFELGYCYLEYALRCSEREKNLRICIENLLEAIEGITNTYSEDDFNIYNLTSRAYEEYAAIRDSLNNYKVALEYKDRALKCEEDNINIITAKLDKARIYEYMSTYSNIVDSKIYLEKAINIYMEICNKDDCMTEEQAFILFNNIGRILSKKCEIYGDYESIDAAIEAYLKAEKMAYCSPEKRSEQFALLQNNIGNSYLQKMALNIYSKNNVKNHKVAIEHYNRALNVYDNDSTRREYTQTVNNISVAYYYLYKGRSMEEDFKNGIKYAEEAMRYRTIKVDPKGFAATNRIMGVLYLHRGKLLNDDKLIEKAMDSLNNALYVYNNAAEKYYCETKYYYAKCLGIKASITGEIKLYEEAKSILMELLKITGISNNKIIYERIINCFNDISFSISNCYEDYDEKYKVFNEQRRFLELINAQRYGFYAYYNTIVMLYNKAIGNDIGYLNEAKKILNEYKNIYIREELDDEQLELLQRIERILEVD